MHGMVYTETHVWKTFLFHTNLSSFYLIIIIFMTENNLYIQSSIAHGLPAMVRNELAKLHAQKQEEFIEEYKRKSKSLPVAYICLICWFHYGYMKRRWMQRLYRLSFWWCFIWTMIDLFRLPWLVKEYNKEVALEVMRNLKVISQQ